jgi:hypothetical protein
MTLIKLIVACFVGTGNFLIGYSNKSYKINIPPIKEVP